MKKSISTFVHYVAEILNSVYWHALLTVAIRRDEPYVITDIHLAHGITRPWRVEVT